MKTSICLILSALALTSTMASADDPVKTPLSLANFSYQGVGFKDAKSELVAKNFECVESVCKRDEKNTHIEIVFAGDRVQTIDTRTEYPKFVDCKANKEEIKNFLTANYGFEYVNKDSSLFGVPVSSNRMGGHIKTNEGLIFVGVSCFTYQEKPDASYVDISINLKDIVAQEFKTGFKYQ